MTTKMLFSIFIGWLKVYISISRGWKLISLIVYPYDKHHLKVEIMQEP
jgi:hypothetical protein